MKIEYKDKIVSIRFEWREILRLIWSRKLSFTPEGYKAFINILMGHAVEFIQDQPNSDKINNQQNNMDDRIETK